jgi:predicted amidohydrolase YtcJ
VSSIVFDGGTVRTGRGEERAEWISVQDGTIAAVGPAPAPAAAERRVDLQGATIVPAFRDAHVHLPATGLYATGLDLRGERSARSITDAFARRAGEDPQAVLFGGNFEDPLDAPLGARDLDEAVGGRPALLARADMHSCIVSSALLDLLQLDEVPGVDRDADGDPTGYLREHAAARAWTWFDSNLSTEQQRDAVRAAVELAYSRGVAEVHEMFVVEWRGWPAAEAFVAAIADVALDVVLFLGTDEVERVKDVSPSRIGGDFFLDGAFGSHTAWMRDPYRSQPPSGSSVTGTSYRSDDELFEFFRSAQRADMQVGVHAIGDAAIEQALRTWERVARWESLERVRSKGHRIEHFECASDDHITRAAHLGLRASVQPAFDRFWGGEGGLYADRIGWERARDMNRFRSMRDGGVMLASGSDSTVTPLDPFLQMASLRDHHVQGQSLSGASSLELTTGAPAALAGHAHRKGAIQPGLQADLALLDRDPLEVDIDEMLATEVLGTWIAGRRVWPPSHAEVA